MTTRLPLYVKHLSVYHQPEGGNTEVSNVFVLEIMISILIGGVIIVF